MPRSITICLSDRTSDGPSLPDLRGVDNSRRGKCFFSPGLFLGEYVVPKDYGSDENCSPLS